MVRQRRYGGAILAPSDEGAGIWGILPQMTGGEIRLPLSQPVRLTALPGPRPFCPLRGHFPR